MKLKQLIIVVSITLSFTAVSTERPLLQGAKAVAKSKDLALTAEAVEKKLKLQKEFVRQMVIPCDPYPVCT